MALHEQMVELLRMVDIFAPLREYELDTIARYCELVTYRKGQVIFTQGAVAESLYVVASGRVGIISVEHEEDNVVIAHITAHESFGEFDFLGRTPRSATALADDDSVLLLFPGEAHSAIALLREHPCLSASMLYRLLGIIAERIWNVNRLLVEKTRWLQDLHKQLLCDKMTGLYNQVYLKEDFVNLLPDFGKHAAVLMIKPDNFKDINDRFGHEAGDHVLNLMAIFLQSELRENDIGVRYRGDEYAAILTDTGKDDAVEKAREISRAFKTMDLSRITGGARARIQVSIGIALYPDDADSSASLVQAAHRKMIAARGAGGNRISV
jgi:diguanylate cyclase